MRNEKRTISLPDVVGKGYREFWLFHGRYRVVKGSRASKKSKTAALNFIVRLMQYPEANLLVVRKVFRTLKDSCFTELRWAIGRLQVGQWWDIKESPLEMTYRPTGQKIYFRGLDDPMKVTSITVSQGYLCWCWIEEAYELTREADFAMLDESIRGALPEESGLFKQITLTFNPWNEKHWLKKRFFDPSPSSEVLAITTDYRCNEWLDAGDLRLFSEMQRTNPRRYQVAGLGGWGIAEGLVYENWEEREFDLDAVRGKPGVGSAFGLDFGYTNDPTALFCGLVDLDAKEIYVFDELYRRGMINTEIAQAICEMGLEKERIRADAAEPKSIEELRRAGLTRISRARKGKDSVNNGIQYIQGFRLVVHPRCVNFLTELANYTWAEDRFGGRLNVPIDDFNHLMDAMRYALEEFILGMKGKAKAAKRL